ncbi:H-NS histone family protein [Polaromonas sp. P1(28)-13]|nr:H-NS histone family protein [Polaromonas sp. P1(28)-13]
MSNLIDIQTQIEKLQKQAADIKAREFDSTVQDIRAKMQAFGITVKDLQTVKRGTKAKGKKIRHPKSGPVRVLQKMWVNLWPPNSRGPMARPGAAVV